MITIREDFDLIIHKLDKDLPYINIYPIGDLHIGSGNLDMDSWNRWKQTLMNDPYGYTVLVGDLLDNGLKSSLTNSYRATMQPYEQQKWLLKELEPIKDKILGCVSGNHEKRSTILADIYPMYNIMAKLDKERLYRENFGFIKVNLGERNKDRQCSYTIVIAHGASKTATEKFSYAIDGMDVFIVGHIHQPKSAFQSKIVIDSKNETVSMKDFVHITVPSFQAIGGYTLEKMYMPQSSRIFPVITLDGTKKDMQVKWV